MNQLYSRNGLEFVWWLVTGVIVLAVMFPIWRDFPQYPFQWVNILFIVSFVTFARYTFLLEHTFLADKQRFKMGFVAFSALIVLFYVNYLGDFAQYIDQNDESKILNGVASERKTDLLAYVRSEMLFFGMGSVVGVLFLAGRLGVSIWRWYNHKRA